MNNLNRQFENLQQMHCEGFKLEALIKEMTNWRMSLYDSERLNFLASKKNMLFSSGDESGHKQVRSMNGLSIDDATALSN